METKKIAQTITGTKNITRKEAIKKAGITALTTASLVFLQTKPCAGTSGQDKPVSVNNTARNPRNE